MCGQSLLSISLHVHCRSQLTTAHSLLKASVGAQIVSSSRSFSISLAGSRTTHKAMDGRRLFGESRLAVALVLLIAMRRVRAPHVLLCVCDYVEANIHYSQLVQLLDSAAEQRLIML